MRSGSRRGSRFRLIASASIALAPRAMVQTAWVTHSLADPPLCDVRVLEFMRQFQRRHLRWALSAGRCYGRALTYQRRQERPEGVPSRPSYGPLQHYVHLTLAASQDHSPTALVAVQLPRHGECNTFL